MGLVGVRPRRPAGRRRIHPTAIVHEGATIGAGTEIGPYVTVGPHVRIGRDCRIGASTVIDGWTEIGDGNEIFPMASVGLIPQDLKFGGESTRLVIGNRNVIREFVTIHRGTGGGGGVTRIGDHNLFMAYAHVAHDCRRRERDDFRQRRHARRPRAGRGLRHGRRLLGRPPVLPGRPARVHRRLLGGDEGRAAVREDRRQSRADLRRQHDRPGAAEASRRMRSRSCGARTGICCTRTRAARWRRSSGIRRCSARKCSTCSISSGHRTAASACAGRAGDSKKSWTNRSC